MLDLFRIKDMFEQITESSIDYPTFLSLLLPVDPELEVWPRGAHVPRGLQGHLGGGEGQLVGG